MSLLDSKLPSLVRNLLLIADAENKAVQELVKAVLEDRMDDAKSLAHALNRSSDREVLSLKNCPAGVR